MKESGDTGVDGKTIPAEVERICFQVVEDIKQCENACDTYSKKRLVVKVLRSHYWVDKFASFIETFAKRKAEFEFALTVHTARTGDETHALVQDLSSRYDFHYV